MKKVAKPLIFCYTTSMPSSQTPLRILGFLSAFLVPLAAAAEGISLLEPINGVDRIETNYYSGFGVFFAYFGLIYPWVVGLGAAVAILMGLVGGVQIMTAGSNDGQRSAGINRFMMSLGGLLLLLFSSTILHLLNPSFFNL